MKYAFVFLMMTCASLAHADIYTFDVNMTCENCSNSISKALSDKFGDKITTNIDLKKDKVVVDTKKNDVQPEAIKEAIAYIGFDVKLISTIPSQ